MACSFTADTLSEVSESGTATSGLNSNWSSREDLRDFVNKLGVKDLTNLYQDRFRVDRKKLEQMLSGDNEALIPADVFFSQIMEDTDTYITWPNKLKLGAKSKKDPHVRIAGWPVNVAAAKERVMTILYTRCNRVTMKVDVSYTDHSHIIGKGGRSIKRVMEETHCHVHFPDSNRSNLTEKSNQVSISGDLRSVECARSRVRGLIPLIFGFEPPIRAQNIDGNCPYVIKIQEQYKVQVMFKTRSKLHATVVLVKGTEWELEQVKHATALLMEFMCDNLASQIPVQMSLQISPQHHQVVLGKNHSNLKAIMHHTKCQIMFSDAQDHNIPSLKKSNISISGSIDNVYIARQLLIGSLPLLIIFDLPDDTAGAKTRPEQITEIQNSCDVTITIRQKTKQVTKACIIKGIEKQASNIYRARNMLLDIDEVPVAADIPRSYQIPSATLPSPAPSPDHDLLVTPTNMTPSPISPYLSPPILSWQYPTNTPSFVGLVQKPQFTFNVVQPPTVQSYGNSPFPEQPSHDSTFLSSLSSEDSVLQSPSRTLTPSPHTYKTDDTGVTSSTSLMDTLIQEKWRRSCNPYLEGGFEAKRLAGLNAMHQRPNPAVCRVPNSAWSGYNISNTSPAGLGLETRAMEDIWKSPTAYGAASSPMNTSNMLDHTPVQLLSRVRNSQWTDLGTLFNSLGLEHYVNLFVQHEVDLALFSTFNENDLITMGVTAFGSRRKMMAAISELNRRSNSTFSAAPGAERKCSTPERNPRDSW